MTDAPPTRVRLTDEIAHRLPLAVGTPRYLVRDDQLPGFFLRVSTKRKAWAIEVTVRRGGRRNVSRLIGYVGQISARDARQEARRLIGELQTRPDASARGPTLAAAWEMYRAQLERRKRKPKTITGYADSLQHVSDWLERPLGRITPEDVVTRHAEITTRAGPYAANRMIAALRAVYRAARKIRRELPPPPTEAVAANAERRRKRALGALDLPAWWAQLQALPNAVRREFHWLLLLTGGRPAALARAQWVHIDLRTRQWLFPDPKGGEDVAFHLPLSREIVAALRRVRDAGAELHRVHARKWVFPGEAGCIVDTTERRDALSHWGGDLRRTFKTLGLECGLSEVDTMILQNHALAGAARGYIAPLAIRLHLRAQQARLSRYINRAACQPGRAANRS